MLTRMFDFVVNNASVIVKRFTVKDNVFTIYEETAAGCSLVEMKDMSYVANSLRQSNPTCFNQSYEFMHQNDNGHAIINPHMNVAETAIAHTHFVSCEILTPSDLTNIMNDIVALQSNTTRRAHFHEMHKVQEAAVVLFYSATRRADPVLVKELLQKMKDNYQTTGRDFISENDASRFIAEYKIYFESNEIELQSQFRDSQKALYNADNRMRLSITELAHTAGYSASMGALFAVIQDTMLMSGVTEQRANIIMSGLSIALFAMTTENISPVIAAMLLEVGMNMLPSLNSKEGKSIKTAVSVGLCAISQGASSSLFGLLKLAVSVTSSYAGSWCIHSITHSLFKKSLTPESVPAASQAVTSHLKAY